MRNALYRTEREQYGRDAAPLVRLHQGAYRLRIRRHRGDTRHGHVAVLNNKSTLIFISVDKISERSVNNLNKIKADYNPTVAIIGDGDSHIKPHFHIDVECENEIQQLFANVVILQQIALETALRLKRNVDSPKGLHKVVVEKNI